jgi:hypothetical protein
VFDYSFHITVGQPYFAMAAGKSIYQVREQKLQGIYVKEDHKEQDPAQYDRGVILKAISAEELVVIEPDPK